MKVICINDFKKSSLTGQHNGLRYGGVYDVVEINYSAIRIINDLDKQHTYKRSRFMTLEEWREKQLNELGIVV